MTDTVLDVRTVSKTFGSTTVLRDLSLRVGVGEVHMLIGENGSGKSTLIKVLSGYHKPDPGSSVLVDGNPVDFGVAEHAYRAGCRFVHQDLGLIEDATVLDNLCLGAGYRTMLGTIRTKAAVRDARRRLEDVGSDLNPMTMVRDLRASERTAVALARALSPDPEHPARLLVLDEPTATLPADEVDRLLEMVRRAASAGLGILFITHHLDEVFRVADRVTVLRDGNRVSTAPIAEVTRAQLVQQLVGAGWVEPKPQELDAQSSDQVAFAVRDLSDTVLDKVTFEVARGEILGIAGLTGSGRDSLLGCAFGAVARTGGTVEVVGRLLRPGRIEESIRAGVAYLPPDRKNRSGLMALTCRENLTLASLGGLGRMWLGHRREREEVSTWIERLDVRPSDAGERPISTLSGGNQQKVLLAKWMRLRPRVFLLDEPTQGVDVGAKAEVHRHLVELAESGAAVVVASVDAEELPALCHRVLVLRNGRIAATLRGSAVTLSEIKNAILGEPEGSADQTEQGVAS